MPVIVMMEDCTKTQDLKLRNQGASWGIKAASFHLPLICLSSYLFLELHMSLLCPSLCFCKILYLRGTVTCSLVPRTWVGNYFKVGRCPLTPFTISPGGKCWEKVFSSPTTLSYILWGTMRQDFLLFSSRIFKTMWKHNICSESSHLLFFSTLHISLLCCNVHYLCLGGDTESLCYLALGTGFIIY